MALFLERRPVRGVVLAFAALMEKTLRSNDHKGGWGGDSVRWLRGRLHQEVEELDTAIKGLSRGVRPKEVAKEAVDVANFAMMIADRCGGMDGQRLSIEVHEDPEVAEQRNEQHTDKVVA